MTEKCKLHAHHDEVQGGLLPPPHSPEVRDRAWFVRLYEEIIHDL